MSPRVARVFYNVVDAWLPEAADVDLLPLVAPRLARSDQRALLWLEWEPRLRLRSLRGFAWLPREQRRDLLGSWERSRLRARRCFATRLRRAIEEAWRQSREGA